MFVALLCQLHQTLGAPTPILLIRDPWEATQGGAFTPEAWAAASAPAQAGEPSVSPQCAWELVGQAESGELQKQGREAAAELLRYVVELYLLIDRKSVV